MDLTEVTQRIKSDNDINDNGTNRPQKVPAPPFDPKSQQILILDRLSRYQELYPQENSVLLNSATAMAVSVEQVTSSEFSEL